MSWQLRAGHFHSRLLPGPLLAWAPGSRHTAVRTCCSTQEATFFGPWEVFTASLVLGVVSRNQPASLLLALGGH